MQIWNRDRDITNSAVLSEALVRAGIAESDSLKYVEMANEDEIESRLQNVTQEAIDARAFGAPTFILREDGEDDRLFFGQGIKNSPKWAQKSQMRWSRIPTSQYPVQTSKSGGLFNSMTSMH